MYISRRSMGLARFIAGAAFGVVIAATMFSAIQGQLAETRGASAQPIAGQSEANFRPGVAARGPFDFTATATPLPPIILSQADALQQVYVNIYKRVDPSVVNIEVFAGTAREEQDSSGSGFVFDTNGHIVTNAHVVQGASEIQVTFRDGYSTTAEVVGVDDYSDLAVIRVNTNRKRLIPVKLGDSNTLLVGQAVIAIGNPFGLLSSMTTGIISATGRTLNSARMLRPRTRTPFQNPSIIQIDAQINPGNSGGPLLNLNGEVIGINTAIRSETGIFQGIGFAVPVNTMKRVVPQLITKRHADYTWLGITSISPTSGGVTGLTVAALAEQFNLPVDYGVLISAVEPGSPAEKAGLRGGRDNVIIKGIRVTLGGDIIVSINKVPVRDFDQLIGYLVENTEVGQVVTLTIYRGNRTFDVDVTLVARPTE